MDIPLDLIPLDTSDESPYLFQLPRDQAAIRTLSALCALQIAHESAQRELASAPATDETEVVAHASCDLRLQDTRQGKQGCNAPALFRRLYVETFVPVYTWAYYAFTHGVYALSSDLSEQEQADTLMRWAVELLTPRK